MEVVTSKRKRKASKQKLNKKLTNADGKNLTGQEARAKRLELGAINDTEAIKDELALIFDGQKVELDKLLAEYEKVKKDLKDKAHMRDEVTIALFGQAEMPYYRFDQLPEGLRSVVDGRLAEFGFSKMYKLFMMMQSATDKLKETLEQMANLQKAIVMYFDNRQVNVTFDRTGLLELFCNEVLYPVLDEKLPRVVALGMTKELQKRLELRKALLEKFGEPEEEEHG
jgi:hypothetical protein